MIGKLTGTLAHKGIDHVMIDVGGVGYVVFVSDRTLATLPGVGEITALYTDLLVREDLLQLFGFSSLLEKEWHRLLTSVQGIGAKGSLAILGTIGPEGVGRAIALGDVGAIKAAPGVGPKIAQRVVHELKDKAPAVMALGGTLNEATGDAPLQVIEPVAAPSPNASVQADALSALGNLGYGPGEAATAIAEAAGDVPEAGAAELIRAALKKLAPKG